MIYPPRLTQFGVAFVFATLLALASLLLCPQVALAQGAPVGWTIVLDNSGTKVETLSQPRLRKSVR
jgi:hypothetical protein